MSESCEQKKREKEHPTIMSIIRLAMGKFGDDRRRKNDDEDDRGAVSVDNLSFKSVQIIVGRIRPKLK